MLHDLCTLTWSDSVECLEVRTFSKTCNACAVGATGAKSPAYPKIFTLLPLKAHPAGGLEISDTTSFS